jgi:hypothetical protein
MKRVLLLTLIFPLLAMGINAERTLPIIGIAHVAFQVSSIE